jgi:hypothetical protein
MGGSQLQDDHATHAVADRRNHTKPCCSMM